MRGIWLALAAVWVVAQGTIGTSTLTLDDPYSIFAKARQHWDSEEYPPQVSYRVIVAVTHGGKSSFAHYSSYYDDRANTVNVTATSDEELAAPYTPHGINTFLNWFGTLIPMSSPQRTFDYLGVPMLAPNYSFGVSDSVNGSTPADPQAVVAEIRHQFGEGPKVTPMPTNSSDLKTIATVEVVHRRYIITLNGLDEVNGHRDYDLMLRPVREPGQYRLRRLWINTETFATDRLMTQGNFLSPGMNRVMWTVAFRDANGATYIDSERTDQSFSVERHAYDSATVTFADIIPTNIPNSAKMSSFASNIETGIPPLTEP